MKVAYTRRSDLLHLAVLPQSPKGITPVLLCTVCKSELLRQKAKNFGPSAHCDAFLLNQLCLERVGATRASDLFREHKQIWTYIKKKTALDW